MRNFFVLFLMFVFMSSCVKDNNNEIKELPINYIKGKNIVLSYDDTPLKDYSFIFEAHKKLDIPGEISIWVNNLKDLTKKTDALSLEQLKEMEKWGFEMASHSYYHTGLAPGTLLKKVNSGDDIIKTHINTVFTWGAVVPYNFELTQNKISESVDIQSVNFNSKGSFIKLRSQLLSNFTSGAKLRHSDEGLIKEIIESKEYLEEHGLLIKHFSYPFGIADERTHKYCKLGGYISGRNATPKRHYGKIQVVYEEKVPNLFSINSFDFAYLTKDEIIEILDSSNSDNIFIMFFSHSWDDNLTFEKIQFLVEEGKKRGYNFTTRSKVFNTTDND